MTTKLDHDTAKEIVEYLIGNQQARSRINSECAQLDDLLMNWDVIEVNELAELRRKAAYYDTLHLSANQEGDR